MNNYCTNCGKKLLNDEIVCGECNTPVVDLPEDYKYTSPQKKAFIKFLKKAIVIFVLCILVFHLVNRIIVNRIQKVYIEPYMMNNYKDIDYTIKYESTGKCIISGSCYSNIGCSGCREYEFVEGGNCKSYFFEVQTEKENFIVTAVKDNARIYVVEGRNIYGEDKES